MGTLFSFQQARARLCPDGAATACRRCEAQMRCIPAGQQPYWSHLPAARSQELANWTLPKPRPPGGGRADKRNMFVATQQARVGPCDPFSRNPPAGDSTPAQRRDDCRPLKGTGCSARGYAHLAAGRVTSSRIPSASNFEGDRPPAYAREERVIPVRSGNAA